MTLMEVTCPWCGERYTTGVIGTWPVGTGHSNDGICTVTRPCSEEGCDAHGIYTVGERGVAERFSCLLHVGDDTIIMAQPGVWRGLA